MQRGSRRLLRLKHYFGSNICALCANIDAKAVSTTDSSAQVRTLKTSEAAALLNVSPNTLRAWERRFGYPHPQRSPGKHRLYTHGEVAALRDALQEGLSISSAVSRAREALTADTNSLVSAISAFELERADAAMEAALALRSVERSVEEVLLPSLQEIGERNGFDSAPWAFAARWAGGWLQRAQRLAPAPQRPGAILIGDATRDELDFDALSMHAMELFCLRAGARVLPLPVLGVGGLTDVVGAFSPNAVVIAGSHASDDDVARWAYTVRSAAGALPMALFHRNREPRRAMATGARTLPESPGDAQRQVLAMAETHHATVTSPDRVTTFPRSDAARRAARRRTMSA
jgi:DNA-binding transcriptional MerR regulator